MCCRAVEPAAVDMEVEEEDEAAPSDPAPASSQKQQRQRGRGSKRNRAAKGMQPAKISHLDWCGAVAIFIILLGG